MELKVPKGIWKARRLLLQDTLQKVEDPEKFMELIGLVSWSVIRSLLTSRNFVETLGAFEKTLTGLMDHPENFFQPSDDPFRTAAQLTAEDVQWVNDLLKGLDEEGK